MIRLFMLLVMTLGCHHAGDSVPKRGKCALSLGVEDKIASTIETRLECKVKDQIVSTVRVLGNMSCEKRIQLAAMVVEDDAATERVDCLIIKKRISTYMASGAPAGWQCTKAPTGSLLDGVCDVK